MFGTLRQRSFALLWSGQVVSAAGDAMLTVALPFYVYEQSRSALATSAVVAARVAPSLLLGAVAGVYVDRWDRRQVLVVADLARAALLLLLLLFAWQGTGPFWLPYPVIVALAAISQFFFPARNALVPDLVEPRRLLGANALLALGGNVAVLIGASLGGVALELMGLAGAVLLNSASYLVSAATIGFIGAPTPVGSGPLTPQPPAGAARGERQEARDPTPWSPVHSVEREWPEAGGEVHSAGAIYSTTWAEWLAGLRLIGHDHVVLTLFLVAGMAMAAQGIMSGLLVVFVTQVLHLGALEFGWLAGAHGAGRVLGGILIERMGRLVPSSHTIALSAAAAGLVFLVMVNVPALALALVLTVGACAAMMGGGIALQTALQQGVASGLRGRVFGAFATTNGVLTLAGMGLAGALSDRLGVVILLDVAGGLFVLAGAVPLIMRRTAHGVVPAPAPRSVTI